MGITKLSLNRLEKHSCLNPGISMLELGAQNLYDTEHYGQIAKEYFILRGVDHTSWDITPHQGAVSKDLREEIPADRQYDVVTDFGTTEHVDGNFYRAHKNIHDHCMVGGIIIHENPKTGNWPGHGKNYVTKDFYTKLSKANGYEILELTEEPAMGNTTDGWNVCAVLRKVKDTPFMTEKQFSKLPVYDK